MRFDWDPRKAAANLSKHSVSFEEASTVFADDYSLTGADPDRRRGAVHHVRNVTERATSGGLPHGTGRYYSHLQRQACNAVGTEAV